jgi:hypothetical protein
MQSRLYSLRDPKNLVNGLSLEPVIINKPNYFSLFPENKKNICSKKDFCSNNIIRKIDGVLVGPVKMMNNCQVLKTNIYNFKTNNHNNELLIKFNKKQ